MLRRVLSALIFALAYSAVLSAQAQRDSPEPVIRALVTAIYTNDVAAYERITLPHPLRSRLTAVGRPNPQKLQQLREVRREDGWKVDLRWWIAMVQMATDAADAPRDSAEFAVRSLLTALLEGDRDEVSRRTTDRRNLELLFVGGPRQPDPSGVLEATVAEMPLVEVGAGEFYDMPTGRIVEGSTTADRKVLVGWFGSIEMPFVLRRVANEWRVEAEPYLAYMNQ
jgi:hypothetical protein